MLQCNSHGFLKAKPAFFHSFFTSFWLGAGQGTHTGSIIPVAWIVPKFSPVFPMDTGITEGGDVAQVIYRLNGGCGSWNSKWDVVGLGQQGAGFHWDEAL